MNLGFSKRKNKHIESGLKLHPNAVPNTAVKDTFRRIEKAITEDVFRLQLLLPLSVRSGFLLCLTLPHRKGSARGRCALFLDDVQTSQ